MPSLLRCLHSRLIESILCLCLVLAASSVRAQDEVDIRIAGVDEALEENIRAHIGILSDRDAQDSLRLRALLLHSTREALEALGYFDPKIEVIISRDLSPPEVELRVELPNPVRWREIDVQVRGEGINDEALRQVLGQRTPQPGDTLNQGVYEDLKRQLRVNAVSRGYFDAAFTETRLEIDRDAHTADIRLDFDTGGRYHLGDVSFGETELSDKRLYQLVPFQSGEVYSEARINHLNKRLLDSGYFASVTVRPQRTDSPEVPIPIEVQLRDNEPNRVGVGLGYGTDSGARFRLNWDKPLVNSDGHSLSSALTLAQNSRKVTLEYRIPEDDPIEDFWVLQGGYLSEEFDGKKYWNRTLGVSRQTLLSSGWWRNPFLRIRSERGFLRGNEEEEDEFIGDQFYLVPGISFTKTRTEGGIHPDRGYRLQFDTEFSDPVLGSDTQYLRFNAEASYLFTIVPKHQLLSRAQAGTIITKDFDEVPLSARFFAGGDQSIRGYSYNSLSPSTDGDVKKGGRFLAIGSLEYLYRFLPNWQAALFVDHGGAFRECCEPRYTGVGVGARWLLPFGNVRVDVANGLDDGGFQLHLFVGGVL